MSRTKQRKPVRLGAMAERQDEAEPTYMRILIQANITDKDTAAPLAWSLWIHVNSDAVVCQKKAKLKENLHPRTRFKSTYKETAAVLSKMTEDELLALKIRVLKKPLVFM
jgi:hypothetical protein